MGEATASAPGMGDEEGSARPRVLRGSQHATNHVAEAQHGQTPADGELAGGAGQGDADEEPEVSVSGAEQQQTSGG